MYKIKQIPEDFYVREASSIVARKKGKYLYCALKKKNYTTERAAQAVADALSIPRKRIGYAGAKDKNAVTEQVISVLGVSPERIAGLSIRDIKLTVLGKGDEPVSLGDLEGNNFEILVRNLDSRDIKKITGAARKQPILVPNYFDEQRFSKSNCEVGRLIVKGRLKDACELIVDDLTEKGKEAMSRNDFAGALRTIPFKILTMFVHSFQSYLFNSAVADYIKSRAGRVREVKYSLGSLTFPKLSYSYETGKPDFPVFGFGTELEADETGEIYRNLISKEGVSQRDFIIRAVPDLSAEGGNRNLFFEVLDFRQSTPEDDELNCGKKKVLLKFFIARGSYATIAIRQLFL